MEQIRKKKIDFTEGKVFFKLLRFILPIVATNLLQTFYNAADMMVVSLSGEDNAVGVIRMTASFIHYTVFYFIGVPFMALINNLGAIFRAKWEVL